MGLLERAAMEAAKKMAESEESHTDVRGIVKASKVFPVVSIASILLALGMAFLKHRQSDAAFYVLAGVFAVLGICLLIYGHNFRIEYDRTGITVYNFFGKPKQYTLQDVQKIELKSDGYIVWTAKGKFGWNSSFSLVQMHFSAICGTIRRRNRYEVDICKKRLWDLRLYGSGVSGGDNCIFCAVRYK